MKTDKSNLKARLAAGEILLGPILDIVEPTMIELICGAGADFLFLEFEHNLRDFSTIAEGLRTAEIYSVPALVRVGERSHNLAERMLDAGAAGIMFPHVTTPDEAKELVSWCRYKPAGQRGSGVTRAFLRHYGNEYERRQRANDDVVVIAIIEDLEGARNLEAILAVDGLTGVAIGPGDLAMDLGVDDWNHPKVTELLDQMTSIVRKVPGRALMRLCWHPEEAVKLAAAGVNMMMINHDVHLIKAMYRSLLGGIRRTVDEATRKSGS